MRSSAYIKALIGLSFLSRHGGFGIAFSTVKNRSLTDRLKSLGLWGQPPCRPFSHLKNFVHLFPVLTAQEDID